MGKLYIVPTPIGNLEDITLRAITILKEVDFILAEDSRHTIQLLKHFSIQKKVVPHHQHNEHKTSARLVDQIAGGATIALVSDAGTPAISDPGYLLVRDCIAADVEVECLPGATAFVPALVNSGLPLHNFCFEGFLPHKKGKQKKIKELADEKRTMVFYESPFRLVKTLADFATHFGSQRRVSVCRELTKIYEETYRGTVEEAIDYFSAKTVKGEIVIVLEGAKE
ncbi:MAG: 16S rRNA (cytidine(1402)-2'-O)-methyltransferase [Flavobacteriales bacterium]|nr:16S rRNA (cytidine(1402)-2'-O)-methyltransferase [Flavobacteriales bacterium]